MNNIWVLLFVGILIRIILALTTYHPDMQVFDIAGKMVALGHILDLYNYSSSAAVFNYPPLIYLFHGIFSFLFNNILGLILPNQANLHLLFLKLPYLIFDLLTGLILIKLFNYSKKSLLAFTLWMFNPINLYATYMMGQFDIIPAFFIILSVYLVVKNKLNWAVLALGGGIAFKLSPVFLLIPLIILGENNKEKLKLLFLGLLPYILSVIPYLPSRSFRSVALLANQSSKSLYANISVSGGESILLFPVVLLFFYFVISFSKRKAAIWVWYLIPLLLFFIFTHYHPQWLIWLTPLLIIDLVSNKYKHVLPILLLLLSWFVSLFFFDPSLTIGIFGPLIPSLSNLPSIWSLLHLSIDYNFMRSVLQSIFTASASYLIYVNITNYKNNEEIN